MAIETGERSVCCGRCRCVRLNRIQRSGMQWADHYAAVYQVPRELVHSIIESSRPGIRTRFEQGAVGLMQLMPATAVTFGHEPLRDRPEHPRRSGVSGPASEVVQRGPRLVAAYLTGETQILRPAEYSNAEVYKYGKSGAIVPGEALETPPD